MKLLFVSDIDMSVNNKAGNKNALMSLLYYSTIENDVYLLNLHRNKPHLEFDGCTLFHFPRFLNMFKRYIFRLFKARQYYKDYKSSQLLSLLVKSIDLIFNFDYIIVEYLELYSAIKYIKKEKTICDLHDVMHLRKSSFANGGLPIAPGIDIECSDEIALMNRFSKIMVIQENELSYLETTSLKSKPILVKRCPLPKDNIFKNLFSEKTLNLGFIGNSADFNIDTINYLFSNLLPTINTNIKYNIYIAGKVTECFNMPTASYVKNLGIIDKVESFYSLIDILVNPIRFGSGLKTKNVESLSYGIPVLTTKCGASGMESLIGKGVEVFENEIDFSCTLEALLARKYSSTMIINSYNNVFGPKACYKDFFSELDYK